MTPEIASGDKGDFTVSYQIVFSEFCEMEFDVAVSINQIAALEFESNRTYGIRGGVDCKIGCGMARCIVARAQVQQSRRTSVVAKCVAAVAYAVYGQVERTHDRDHRQRTAGNRGQRCGYCAVPLSPAV